MWSHEFAHCRLAQWCFPATLTPPWERNIDAVFLTLGVIGLAQGLVDWCAHEYAVEHLDTELGDEELDPVHILSEKHRGQWTYEDVTGLDAASFIVTLSER